MPQPHRVRARRKKRAELRLRGIHQKKCHEAMLDLGAKLDPLDTPSARELRARKYLVKNGAGFGRLAEDPRGNHFLIISFHDWALVAKKAVGRSFDESSHGNVIVRRRDWVEVASWFRQLGVPIRRKSGSIKDSRMLGP